jgi:acyl-CoA synthetase (AMP-forming)/AMP-acid ligase II
MIHTSPLPDVEFPDVSVTEYVLRKAEEHRDKAALIDGMTGRTVTHGQLRDAVHAVAGGLRADGFEAGDVLAIVSPNVPEYGVVFHAVCLLGGTVTTINPTYTPTEIHHQLVDSGAKEVFTVGIFLDNIKDAIVDTRVDRVYTFDGADGSTPYTALLGGEVVTDQVPIDLDEHVAVLPYSSGTTGVSKGVMLTHRNLVANLIQMAPMLDMSRDDEVVIAVLPFFHIYGMQVLMNGAVSQGATCVTMPRFDLEAFLQILQDYKVTTAYLVPPIVLAMAKHPLVDNYDLGALRLVFSGAAPLSGELGAEASGRVGADVVQGYGLTETSPVTHSTPKGKGKAGSIGVPLPQTEVRIVDAETGADLGLDEDGEVWIRGPQVMKGYLNNPQATAACIDDEGWFHTGDIGHVDSDGHFYIVDRLKELIKYKGFQVAPAELEALLLTHPAVADSAVIPVPDDEAGEIPKAFVVLKPDQTPTADDLMAFIADEVAGYKQIRQLEFVDQIPKSASGKILRRLLRDRERERLASG